MNSSTRGEPIPAVEGRSRQLRVLLVEDDLHLRELIQTFLSSHGFEVVTAGDGISAANLVFHQTFDAVVSDIRLPGVSGMAVARRPRASATPPPVILITGYPEWWTSREDAYVTGVLKVLSKPFDLAELARILERSVNRHDEEPRDLRP